jgi:hypothetical protein
MVVGYFAILPGEARLPNQPKDKNLHSRKAGQGKDVLS